MILKLCGFKIMQRTVEALGLFLHLLSTQRPLIHSTLILKLKNADFKTNFLACFSVLTLQFLRDTFDAHVFPEVAEARAATRDFLHIGFGEPAPLPV